MKNKEMQEVIFVLKIKLVHALQEHGQMTEYNKILSNRVLLWCHIHDIYNLLKLL
jgi:hypothetical protein